MSEQLIRLLRQSSIPHALFNSRKREYEAVKGYAYAYGIDIDEIDFDNAYATLYGDGCEVEWPKE